MATTIKFSSDEYRSLMAVFNILKENCDDITIYNGKIHQLSNSKTMIYDIDLTKYFKNSTIYINSIKKHFSLLNMFAISNNEVMLRIDDKKYVWLDKKSKIECIIPEPSTLNPAYMDETSKRSQDTKSMGSKIFETVLDRTIIDRISQASSNKALESKIVTLNVEEDNAKFIIIPQDLLACTKLEVHSVDELNDESFNCSTQYDINTFILKTEELKISLYKNKVIETGFTAIYNCDIEGINFTMWSLTNYVSNK